MYNIHQNGDLRIVTFLLILIPLTVNARNVLELSLDGGYSSIQYQLSEGKRLGGIGYGADLGYAYFFSKNVGLGLGVGFRHYAGGAQIDGVLDYKNVIDTDTEPYEHLTTYTNWREKQDMYFLEIPLSLQFYIPLNGVNLWMALGASYDVALWGNTAAQGDLTHRGYYKKWDLTLDLPSHGFYETSDFKPTQSIKPQSIVTAFARFDVGIPVIRNLDFVFGVNAHYALLSAYPLVGSTPLGFRNDKEGWKDAHYFMTDYTSLINTPIVSGKALPWCINLEIGLKCAIASTKNKSCRKCMILDNEWKPIRGKKRCLTCEQ